MKLTWLDKARYAVLALPLLALVPTIQAGCGLDYGRPLTDDAGSSGTVVCVPNPTPVPYGGGYGGYGGYGGSGGPTGNGCE